MVNPILPGSMPAQHWFNLHCLLWLHELIRPADSVYKNTVLPYTVHYIYIFVMADAFQLICHSILTGNLKTKLFMSSLFIIGPSHDSLPLLVGL